jgi:hypothetical protein
MKPGAFIAATFSGTCLAGLMVWFGSSALFPNFSLPWFLAMFAFFAVAEIGIVWFVCTKSRKSNARQMVNVYMLAKIVKLLLAIGFFAVYFVLERTAGLKQTLVAFLVYYILMLLLETYIFTQIEKRLNAKDTHHQRSESESAGQTSA